MEDIYVRKDTLEAIMSEMRAMQAASEARVAAQIAEIRAEREAADARTAALIAESKAQLETYKAESNARLEVYRADSRRESESLAADIRSIKDRLDSIEQAASRRWTITGVFVAIVSAGITLFSIIPALRAALGL